MQNRQSDTPGEGLDPSKVAADAMGWITDIGLSEEQTDQVHGAIQLAVRGTIAALSRATEAEAVAYVSEGDFKDLQKEGGTAFITKDRKHKWIDTIERTIPLYATPPAPRPALALTEKALHLAVNMVMEHEPPDSRAVSPEAVALAAVVCKCDDQACWDVIDTALASAKRFKTGE